MVRERRKGKWEEEERERMVKAALNINAYLAHDQHDKLYIIRIIITHEYLYEGVSIGHYLSLALHNTPA